MFCVCRFFSGIGSIFERKEVAGRYSDTDGGVFGCLLSREGGFFGRFVVN